MIDSMTESFSPTTFCKNSPLALNSTIMTATLTADLFFDRVRNFPPGNVVIIQCLCVNSATVSYFTETFYNSAYYSVIGLMKTLTLGFHNIFPMVESLFYRVKGQIDDEQIF